MSNNAADRINSYISNRGDIVEFVDNLLPGDLVYYTKGIKIVINKKSLTYLDGTELDYTKEGLNEGFKFINPNVKDECGCGESFTV